VSNSAGARLADESGRDALRERMGHEGRLEDEALRRLADFDLEGCRRCLETLVGRLDVDRRARADRRVPGLLLDILQRVNRGIPGRADGRSDLDSERLRLIEEFAPPTEATQALERFFAALERLLGAAGQPRRDPATLVRRAQSYIERHYPNRIGLSSVGAALHASPNYLSRVFRRETGTTLTAYIQRVRLDHARRLLADPAMSLSEVACQVGYQSYRHFYRNMVRVERGAPRELRRQMLRCDRPGVAEAAAPGPAETPQF